MHKCWWCQLDQQETYTCLEMNKNVNFFNSIRFGIKYPLRCTVICRYVVGKSGEKMDDRKNH